MKGGQPGAKMSPVVRMVCGPTIAMGNFVPTVNGNWSLFIVR
jgi:hypothetical protein